MKITIDTKQDSRDEIRKIVRLLNELLEMKHDNPAKHSSGYGDSKGYYVQGYNTYGSSDFRGSQSPPNAAFNSPGFFNMFDNAQTTTPSDPAAGMAGEQMANPQAPEKKKADPAEFEIYEY